MNRSLLPSLFIGDIEVNPPIIQGGMGIRVSRSSLAAAVANQGCVGTIASVGLGKFLGLSGSKFIEVNNEALVTEIRKARSLTKGPLAVNVLVALSNYEHLVKTAVAEDIDIIVSGAGLPLDLPKYTDGKDIKLIPIVSSARALAIISKKWKRSYGRLPDAVIVESPKAGGHLGYSYDAAEDPSSVPFDDILTEVIKVARGMNPPVPVIAAGGIFDGKDIAHALALGASGVQMATRFVCTDECDVSDAFKQAYLDSKQGDTTIIKSPVGMPGRVINGPFVERVKQGETKPFACRYQCLRTCNPKTAPYCIAEVLSNAADGKMENAFVFAGSNCYRCNEIVPVAQLIDELARETVDHLGSYVATNPTACSEQSRKARSERS